MWAHTPSEAPWGGLLLEDAPCRVLPGYKDSDCMKITPEHKDTQTDFDVYDADLLFKWADNLQRV